MKKLILAGAAALALAVPAVAQDMAVTSSGDVYVLTEPQQVIYDAWPVERQTAYTGWPNTYQTYYWTLTEPQQNGWWMLTDDQRGKVYAMTPEQRVAAWTAIERQMSGMPASASATATAATTASTMASTGGPTFVSNSVVQTTPAANNTAGEYPPCKGDMQDHCINPREAGLKYGNVPLKYWPGKPASEIPGKMPAEKM